MQRSYDKPQPPRSFFHLAYQFHTNLDKVSHAFMMENTAQIFDYVSYPILSVSFAQKRKSRCKCTMIAL